MNKIEFSHDSGDAFYNELVLEVNQYFADKGIEKHGGKKMIIKMLIFFTVSIFLYSVMMLSENVFHFLLFYLMMGVSILFTAINLSHDAAHNSAVKSKFWNRVIFDISFNLLGTNSYLYKKSHNTSHHKYCNIQGSDSDIIDTPFLRMNPNQQQYLLYRYQWFYASFIYPFYTLHRFLFRDLLNILNLSKQRVKVPSSEIIKLIFYKIVYLGLMIFLPIWILPFNWETVMLAFILNHFIFSLIIIMVLGLNHTTDYVVYPKPNEEGKLNMSWPTLQLRTSVDYVPDSISLNWTLGGFNSHVIHHLMPNISHVHFLTILPILRRLLKKHNLEYIELSFPELVRSHFRFLKQMGREKNVTLKQFLP